MKRQSGVLLPVFSLPSEFGCGNFGDAAYEWIDRLCEGGFSLWQVLPLGIPDGYNSPYASLSYGGDTRINTPGVALGCWQYRVTREQLDSVDWKGLSEMNKRYGRY